MTQNTLLIVVLLGVTIAGLVLAWYMGRRSGRAHELAETVAPVSDFVVKTSAVEPTPTIATANNEEVQAMAEPDAGITGLFPTLPTPVLPVAPTVPYSGLLVWLAMSPRVLDNGEIDASASIRARPYRELPDGKGGIVIDEAPEKYDRIINIGSALETQKADPRMAAVIDAISKALQDYVTAAG